MHAYMCSARGLVWSLPVCHIFEVTFCTIASCANDVSFSLTFICTSDVDNQNWQLPLSFPLVGPAAFLLSSNQRTIWSEDARNLEICSDPEHDHGLSRQSSATVYNLLPLPNNIKEENRFFHPFTWDCGKLMQAAESTYPRPPSPCLKPSHQDCLRIGRAHLAFWLPSGHGIAACAWSKALGESVHCTEGFHGSQRQDKPRAYSLELGRFPLSALCQLVNSIIQTSQAKNLLARRLVWPVGWLPAHFGGKWSSIWTDCQKTILVLKRPSIWSAVQSESDVMIKNHTEGDQGPWDGQFTVSIWMQTQQANRSPEYCLLHFSKIHYNSVSVIIAIFDFASKHQN